MRATQKTPTRGIREPDAGYAMSQKTDWYCMGQASFASQGRSRHYPLDGADRADLGGASVIETEEGGRGSMAGKGSGQRRIPGVQQARDGSGGQF